MFYLAHSTRKQNHIRLLIDILNEGKGIFILN